jgi:sec-independent protein translocase protein TatA
MPNIGPGELILILVIALVIIGPGRLPDVGSALGKSIREFRKASSDISESARVDTTPLPPAAAPPVAVAPATVAPAALAPVAVPPAAPEVSAPAAPAAPAAAPRDAADDESTNLPV